MKAFIQKRYPLWFLLALGLITGLIFVFMVPPWQHYDEPGHFEFAWLIANRSELPQKGDFDWGARDAIAASMVAYRFREIQNTLLPVFEEGKPPDIGISQVDSQAFYYLLASLPLRLLGGAPVEIQLNAVRLVSYLLFLLTLVAAYGLLGVLLPGGHPLRWAVPAAMAMLPAFVDIMTAANNVVGAVLLFTLFLWMACRLMVRGFSWRVSVLMLLTVLSGIYTQSTTLLAIPLLPLVVLFSLFRKRFRFVPWVLLGVGSASLLLAIFDWGDAAFWARATPQIAPTRELSAMAPVGEAVFRLDSMPVGINLRLAQSLPHERREEYSGKTFTLGGWVWSDEDCYSPFISLGDGFQWAHQYFHVRPAPKFYAFHFQTSLQTRNFFILLTPPDSAGPAGVIFLDGLVMVEGEWPLDEAPVFDDASASAGTWGGRRFENILRNASAERAGLRFQPWAESVGGSFFPATPSVLLYALTDWAGSWKYFSVTAQRMLHTFWASFGWNGVFLLPILYPYSVLGVITLAGMIGAVPWWFRVRKRLPGPVWFVLFITVAGVWAMAFLRGVGSILVFLYIPLARYAFPAIVPTMLILVAGWREWALILNRRLNLPAAVGWAVLIAGFAVLFVFAVISNLHYYANV